MSPFAVVEHLDVIDDVGACIAPCCVDVLFDPLTLEQLKEALSNGVVVTVTAPAHACLQVVICQEVLPVVTNVLTALIRMHGDGSFRSPALHRHQQRIEHQLPLNPR